MYLVVYLPQALLVISAACVLARAPGPSGPRGPLVKTKLGYVEGIETETSQNFYGIPFAQPPVDSLRWKPPMPATCWHAQGVLDATTMKDDCAQEGCEFSLPPAVCPKKLSEDCLYLNIYRPIAATRSSRYAVMVFIPGGGFQITAAASFYRGDVFVEKADVILVTMSYRIGVFGFLVTDDGEESATGNYGLQDQRMAIEWISDNIESFGGDPNMVTLFGQSAGAQSIAAHMTSLKADNLFHAAIFESLPFSIPFKSYDDAIAQGLRVANILNCGSEDIMTCIRQKSWQELASAQTYAGGFEGTLHEYQPWGPHVDDDEVVEQIVTSFLNGNIAPKPLIIGTVTEEGVGYVMNRAPVSAIEYAGTLLQTFGPKGCLIFNRYPPSQEDLRPQMVAVSTDFVFTCPNLAVTQSVSSKPEFPNAWHYIYDQALPPNVWEHLTYCEGRVCHAAEMPVVFQSAEIEGFYEYSPEELNLSNSIIRYWSNFAKSGNPNSLSDSGNCLKWPAYGPEKRSMRFKADNNGIIRKYNEELCKFWNIFVKI